MPGTGARVALIAPAGPLRGESDLAIAESHATSLGWTPVRGRHALATAGYLAGTDAERLSDLQWALDDPSIDVVWCVRGGYGMTRLVPHLSLDAFAAHPKTVLGFSDVTALHAAIATRCGVVSFHAPVARAPMPAMSLASLRTAVMQAGDPCGTWDAAIPVRGGTSMGRLTGGNLALLAALAGTRDAMRADGAIVILEDVSEPAYRVDRMLRQLEQSGALDGCVGLAVGQFTEVPADSAPDAMTCGALVAELAGRLRVPCLSNLPIGHIDDQWTVPLGAVATLDVSAQALRVQVGSFPTA